MDRSRRGLFGLPLALAMKHPVAQAAQQAAGGFTDLPANLPVPKDDGGARHLRGMAMPDLELPSTANRRVNLAKISSPRLIVYSYPMTGQPGKALPAGWDDIPGARGCTPETCGFRDHHTDLAKLHAEVFGVSTQSTPYQQEMVARLNVPFEVLSDEHFAFTHALNLPTFTVEGMTLMKRLTLVARNQRIEHVFYPVFPPDRHAEEVIAWLRAHPV
ncbi:MAG TPA: peroxiredoxin [Vicinamibacterales bacterium]|nr:peroxiredoxin [Vicinamibacterales bacterium]